jgi:hypothetical protein
MAQRPSGLPTKTWYLRPQYAIWLGPLLIVACVAIRFGWGGLAGPPFPFWGLTYLVGMAGVLLTYAGIYGRQSD